MNCEWKEGGSIRALNAPITVRTPFDLESIEIKLEAFDANGNLLPRGTGTVRFEQVSSASPHTFPAQFNATLGWPQDVTCKATIVDYFKH